MESGLSTIKRRFGTAPVFLATISTILGAVLFLRFGFAVGHTGFWGTMQIILLGHLITIPTALAFSEIATNHRVEGGGAYFIISRSFGLNIGAAIGIALFLAQAISVAFYVIAFSQAFEPLLIWLEYQGIYIPDMRWISIPSMALLTLLILTKGADLGVKSLYVVSAVLFVSISLFFLGGTDYDPPSNFLYRTIENPDSIFYVFAIIFPAFTGIAAGLGLSGDLKEPRRSIPLGTLGATLFGMVVYVFIAWKLAYSASPEDLANDQMIMSRIALWGPAIPIGLAAATISSALGSIMIAPRTLQALAADRIFPVDSLNDWLAKERKSDSEPIQAALITCGIAFMFVFVGELNFVAEIISTFFMATYGAICLASFMEHFAADPAYRPTFRSRWYISLLGAILCIWLMFKMSFMYSLLSVSLMFAIYFGITYLSQDRKALSKIFQGVIFQVSRQLQVFLQKEETELEDETWRPAVICLTKSGFQRLGAFDMVRWISYKYGFGTYIHQIDGYLSKETSQQAKQALESMIRVAEKTRSNVYFDTLVCPSSTTAIAQVVQLPGISGKENNSLMMEFFRPQPDDMLSELVANFSMVKAMDFDVLVLASAERGFGFRKQIHIWITSRDYENANLMILLGFIILGHPEWHNGQIKIFATSPEENHDEVRQELQTRIKAGRLPISPNNIEILATREDRSTRDLISEKSSDADLTILGFRTEALKKQGVTIFQGYDKVGNILFVNTQHQKELG